LLSSLCFYLVDVTLLGAVLARIRRERYLHVVRSFFSSTLPPFVVMMAITAILVKLWQFSPWWSLLLLRLPTDVNDVLWASRLEAEKTTAELE
jgi:hypothetical protein